MSEQTPGIARLEAELDRTRHHAFRAAKEIHAIMAIELETALARARTAEARAMEAERWAISADRRANTAELEISRVRDSATWRAGRALVAGPAWIRRFVRKLSNVIARGG